MISDLQRLQLFPIVVHKVVPNLDHMAIADYTIDHSKKWERYTCYRDDKAHKDWLTRFPHKKQFEQCITDVANNYLIETNRPPLSSNGAGLYYWANVYDHHDNHDLHNHPNSLLSGTYYPQACENSAPIIFHAPFESRLMYDFWFQENGNSHFVHYPKTGDMLIWPSWLDHRVSPQGNSNIQRISIPFNVVYQ